MSTYTTQLATLVMSLGLGILMGCSTYRHTHSNEELLRYYEGISNDGVVWDGDDLGLQPQIIGENEKWILHSKTNPNTLLLQALSAPNKWIVAHVILTLRQKEPFMGTSVEWNGLNVEIFADNIVRIDESQRPIIQKFWEDKLRGQGCDIPQDIPK